MANIPVPVLKVGGASAIITFLYVFVLFGALHLYAISTPDKKFSKAVIALGF